MKKGLLSAVLVCLFLMVSSCEVEDISNDNVANSQTELFTKDEVDSGKDEEPDPDDRDRTSAPKVNALNFDPKYDQYSREGDSGKDEEPDPDERD